MPSSYPFLQNSVEHLHRVGFFCKEKQLKAVNYFCNKLYRRCLRWLLNTTLKLVTQILFWSLSAKDIMLNLKSLVTMRMNETFPCLACYGQKLIFLLGNRDKDKHKFCERKRWRWNRNKFFKQWYLRSVLNSSCLRPFINNIAVH